MKKFLIILSLALLPCCKFAFAKSPSFTYLELEYIAAGSLALADDSIGVDVDIDGFSLNGSVELGIFFLQASRFELESETVLDSQLKDSISTIAMGMTFELPQTQLYGLIRARHDDISLRGGFLDEEVDEDVDAGIIGGEVGVRVNLTDRIEINANVGIPSTDDGKSYGVGVQFFIANNIGLTLDFNSIELEEDDINGTFDTTSLGLRFTF